jgi:hypothetical protein
LGHLTPNVRPHPRRYARPRTLSRLTIAAPASEPSGVQVPAGRWLG